MKNFLVAAAALAALSSPAMALTEAECAAQWTQADTDANGVLNAPDTAEARALDPNGAGTDWALRLFVRADDREDIRAGDLISQWFTQAGAPTELRQVSEDPQLYDEYRKSTYVGSQE